MKKKSYNIWLIEGYVGNNDYDNPNDYNIHKEIIADIFFTKEDVIINYMNTFKILEVVEETVARTNLLAMFEEMQNRIEFKDISELDTDIEITMDDANETPAPTVAIEETEEPAND